MVNLFLSQPKWNCDADDRSNLNVILTLLNKLGSQIQSLVTIGARSEVRLWLCSALSSISISRRRQVNIFMRLLRSNPRKTQLVSQLLQLMFEKRPRKLGSVLAKRSYLLEKFFAGNPKRILEWFSDFAVDGGSDHKRGARAFAQFAFANRDICWEELEWRGKHGQSPAVVATKPHYLLDLDVQRTIENFLDNVPEFWSSNEFAESLKDGQILFLDTKFFLELFIRLMYEEDVSYVWDAVEDFLNEESFSSLTQHLLITLEEPDLCQFLELLGNCFSPKTESWDFGDSSCWLEVVLSKYADTESIDELLLLNSIINQGRQLLRLVLDENVNDEGGMLKETMADVWRGLENGTSFTLLLRELSKMKYTEAIKLLGLLSWTIHFRLSEECQSVDSWESLFRENGIKFRRSSDHSLLSHNGFSEESESDSDGRSRVSRKRHKKGKKKRKKKKKRTIDDDNDDDLIDDELLGLHQISRSWLLSTDGFSATWTSVDLPEYIARYCLSTWMKWFLARQK
ncbi:uncharacterized protein LOC18013125 [Eutrema salsugineum]|uniref:uncharacterized protein LOC18013125 n=1 Tax=Eutrema salsugineum TaxID=72664 RepID=UPI000CED4355|nr:uncharacterized protein LOC18013125 [Eutrema salsugineum]XP_024007073.1 uncharacterized protein LOC18013125 [Eutrema salsugineum]XP_024007074.1 uncharacterized protein LOC18013125 [Eutrema salsugineum]XP_024007075.1 uncharacterized protein LOC18013125 [Eutrema salsugineum]XP_024007076.1 uncharacterized protein LOC18013125 [Eutrema salsugineum]